METAKEFQKLCKGLQHVGIPTADLQKTLAFYESLGFEKAYLAGSVEDGRAVAFYRLGDLTLEIYGNGRRRVSPAPSTTSPWMCPISKRPTLWCRGWAIPW